MIDGATAPVAALEDGLLEAQPQQFLVNGVVQFGACEVGTAQIAANAAAGWSRELRSSLR